MKLRSMSATVERHSIDVVVKETGEIVSIPDAFILKSYRSIVAVYPFNDNKLYLLPRYDYSNTTWKHLHAFVQDYCEPNIPDYCASVIHSCESGKLNNNGYVFCSGWYDGMRGLAY